MRGILESVSQGDGLFASVFAGVLISVGAGLLKDPVERWLLSLSSALDQRRRAHEHMRKRLVNALLADDRYFELARFRATFACSLVAASSVVHLCAPVVLALQPDRFVKSSVIWSAIAPGLGLFSMLMAYSAARRVELINAATVELRLRQRLPRLP